MEFHPWCKPCLPPVVWANDAVGRNSSSDVGNIPNSRHPDLVVSRLLGEEAEQKRGAEIRKFHKTLALSNSYRGAPHFRNPSPIHLNTKATHRAKLPQGSESQWEEDCVSKMLRDFAVSSRVFRVSSVILLQWSLACCIANALSHLR